MGCVIEDNVAFETLGHCYFLEDGVEEGTVMRGNLGLNTRPGTLLPSDRDPATFWITHPSVTVTGNVAGGSVGKGFWFLFPALPTGASGPLQRSGARFYYRRNELFFTPIANVSNNFVHSSREGFYFDEVLTAAQGTSGRSTGRFNPRKEPLNPGSEMVTTNIRQGSQFNHFIFGLYYQKFVASLYYYSYSIM